MISSRAAAYPIDPLFLDRWSPSAFDASRIDDGMLMTLFEAARWAPSAYNVQPWRFLYAHRDGPDWESFNAVLIPYNRDWASHASALVFILSDSLMQMSPDTPPVDNHSHSFDAGAAWASLAFQATRMGLAVHGMSGIEFDRARDLLAVPERFRIEAAIAIGRMGDPSSLPDKLRAREEPSGRRPLEVLVSAGPFPRYWGP